MKMHSSGVMWFGGVKDARRPWQMKINENNTHYVSDGPLVFRQLVYVENAQGFLMTGCWTREATRAQLEELGQTLLDLCELRGGVE
jgi:hypothetical protein